MAISSTDAAVFSRLFPDALRRGPGHEAISRRIAILCHPGRGERVLDLGCGTGTTALLLAREWGCQVTGVDHDEAALATLRANAQNEGLGEWIEPLLAEAGPLQVSQGEFQVVVAEGSLCYLGSEIETAIAHARSHLALNGRLALNVIVRVGRTMPAAVDAFYRERGEILRTPGEHAQLLERGGFEPLAVEAYADAVMDEWYRFVEQTLQGLSGTESTESIAALRREVDIFRHEGGRSCVDMALLVARRKEPQEKSRASQDNG